MTSLTTTQAFGDNSNFIAGSLNFVTVELKDPKHRYWDNDVTAGAGKYLVKGVEYTVKTANSAGDATSVGGAAATLVVGDTFMADDGNAANAEGTNIPFTTQTSAVVSYKAKEGTESGLAKIIQSVQSRASIVYIGTANSSANNGPGPGKVRLMLENAGHEDYARNNAGNTPVGEDGYPTGDARELQRALREQEGQMDTDDSVWVVEQFRF